MVDRPRVRKRVLGAVAAVAFVGLGFVVGRSTRPDTPPYVESPRVPVPPRAALLPSFAAAVERTMPGVVAVRAIVPVEAVALPPTTLGNPLADPSAAAADQEGPAQLARRDGSGFVVHQDGLVVTARHLTVRALHLVVDVPNQGLFAASLVGEDEVTDLAVLRLDDPPPDLVPLELGPSEDLRAGDWIVAVGNPHGLRQSVTAGIVSFVGRHLTSDDLRPSSEFVQFSAPVSPGSSGCPLVDLEGRVVGVTTQASEVSESLSFAIPSRTLKWALDEMNRSPDGRVHRGRMGVGLQPRRGKDAAGRPLPGVLVTRVVDDGPAQQAGLRIDDVVLAVDDREVADTSDLHERITRSSPGSVLRLRVLRGGVEVPPIEVRLADAAPRREGEGVGR